MNKYTYYLNKFDEYGLVEEVYHPIALVSGLPHVKPGEVVWFEQGIRGQVMYLHEQKVEVLVFSRKAPQVGQQVSRSGKTLSIPVTDLYLGQVINPLGESLLSDSNTEINSNQASQDRQLDIPPQSIKQRSEVVEAFETGISLIDLLLPLGKGQRELVVGDRQTGKSSSLLTIVKKQVSLGNVCIITAIGKKMMEIEQTRLWLEREKLIDKVVIVAAGAKDAQSHIYLAPFSAMTLAEYFRDKGNDVLVIMDDLSTHAQYYRELSLLARRFPGRDSYPGDIFFTHARLLERAGNYLHPEHGTVSITCLPLAETTDNELTDYIVSNLIGITDGHLLFDSNEFVKGRRPSINVHYSVTRVGRQTQTPLYQDVSQRLVSFLSEYERSQRFSHFGAELGDNVKKNIKKGNLLHAFFNQGIDQVVPKVVQVVGVAIIWSLLFEELGEDNVPLMRDQLVEIYNTDQKMREWFEQLTHHDDLYEVVDAVSANRNKLQELCLPKKK